MTETQQNSTNTSSEYTFSLDEIAAIFRRKDANSFRELRPKLEAAGFPTRIPGTNLWSKPAVDLWFSTLGLPPEIQHHGSSDNVIDMATDFLEGKYAS